MSLRVLLVGNGGREHAIAWKLSQSPQVEAIFACPGNGGTATCPKTSNLTSVSADDFAALVAFAKKENIGLVVPGPEAPLVAGIEEPFRLAGIPVFGPSKEAAAMEGSKTFSKDFMARHNIPTAAYKNFSDATEALAYIDSIDHDVVIKATGLAAGKGVIIPTTKEEARAAIKEIMVDRAFGDAGSEVVIEEFLTGDELSILTFSDGYTFKSLPAAQDHKRIFDGDKGPNTGGMGCYAPTNIATKSLLDLVDKEILEPTIRGLRQERSRFVGVLFTGLMITPKGPKVLEYNVRFGDPETQTVLPLLSADTDLAEVMLACTGGYLDAVDFRVDNKFSATVVTSAGGYPNSYAKGTPMTVQPATDGIVIFHAGTALDGTQLRTAGGRVIAANATAESLEAAVAKAYEGVKLINFDGMYYRKDIAHRAFKKKVQAEMTYSQAGVSIDGGNDFVERIKAAVRSTKRPGADAEIGGFGGELDLNRAGYAGGPILVGAIDGVGTKLMIAQAIGKHDTVGIDLVAMNVNDLVVQGAEPLMFLDYYGCSKLDQVSATAFVEGVAAGCRESGCALIGGETAEMPGMYQEEDYDAAGAAIGVVTAERRLPKLNEMKEGDVLIGLESSGVHSNGYSLVRKVVTEAAGLSYTDACPWEPTKSIGEVLLTPTRLYVKPLLQVFAKDLVKGAAHITGGGLQENVPRMLPAHLAADIDLKTWERPAVFKWLRETGNVPAVEMCRTFNNGLGMILAVDATKADAAVAELTAAGQKVHRIGKLIARNGEGCILTNLESW